MRFIHLSDIHLGYQQYGLAERARDFAQVFDAAIQESLQRKVDAVLIAGDLFHKSAIDPAAYLQAAQILKKTRSAGVPVLVVEGNHDQARFRDRASWLDVLAQEGYIHLLRAEFPRDLPCAIKPWDPQACSGTVVEIQNVRFVGLQWLGASLPALFPEFVQALQYLEPRDGINTTVVITHAALQGELARVPTFLTNEQLPPLQSQVQYLALGHLHKPFVRDDWAYNPGSLEVYDCSEIRWDKGWNEVEVSPGGQLKVTHRKSSHRPFFSEFFSVESYSEPAALYRSLQDHIRARAKVWGKCDLPPVIEIRLVGQLHFDRLELDLSQVEKFVRNEARVCHALVNTTELQSSGIQINVDESLPQDELERQVLQQIAESDSRFASQAGLWARTMLEVKEMALSGRSPEAIIELLQTQADLVDGMSNAD